MRERNCTNDPLRRYLSEGLQRLPVVRIDGTQESTLFRFLQICLRVFQRAPLYSHKAR